MVLTFDVSCAGRMLEKIQGKRSCRQRVRTEDVCGQQRGNYRRARRPMVHAQSCARGRRWAGRACPLPGDGTSAVCALHSATSAAAPIFRLLFLRSVRVVENPNSKHTWLLFVVIQLFA
ncbi:hypothetical protein ACJJTC_007120 [Scirpophaga incertulas]